MICNKWGNNFWDIKIKVNHVERPKNDTINFNQP